MPPIRPVNGDTVDQDKSVGEYIQVTGFGATDN